MDNLTEDYRKLYELYKNFGSMENFNIVFYSTNQPIPYKNLFIYPVKTIYYIFFHTLAECFFINKYDSKIDECMGMNPLQFLFYRNSDKGIDNAMNYLPLLEHLLLMCLNKSQTMENGKRTIEFVEKNKKQFIRIENKDFGWRDFEKIRDIICEQNCIQLPDWKIHPDIRKKLKEKDELMARINKQKIASFEELIDCLMLASGYSEEYILNLSIRRFTNLLKRYDIMKNYELMTILTPNMDKKDREKIMSWNCAIPKQDQYLSKVTNLSEIEKQISGMNK